MFDPVADLGAIANQDFGEVFVIDDGTPAGRVVTGRWNNFYRRLDLSLGVESDSPAAVLLASDAGGIAHGTELTRVKTVTTYAVREMQPDGKGWVLLILTEG
jgi:hypothetical protein